MKKIYGQFNIFSFVIIIIATVLYLPTPSSWLRRGKIYVSPQGHDWLWGATPTLAVKTIQRAIDMASAGEEIVIMPGAYRETIHIRNSGFKDHPIKLKADQPGTVIITNAVTSDVVQSLTWTSAGDGIFSTQPPWDVYRVSYKEENLYHAHWGVNLAKFRSLVKRKNASGAFYYDRRVKRLYVFLPQGKSLKNISIPRKVPSPDQFGNVPPAANVWIEAEHIIFDGLRFELGVGASILLWNASNITIRDCVFTGAMYGVASYFSIRPATNILVEYSLYHNYPQHNWYENWLTWQEIYSTGGRSSLVQLNGPGVVIRHNLVTHAGDGLQISPRTHHPGAKIYGNLLFRGTDDAIEFDGAAENIHVYNNLIYDFFVSLGLSPVLKGPVVIENNIFLHPFKPQHIKNPAHFKLLNPWFNPKQLNSNHNTIRNIQVRHNTFVGNWLAWWHKAPIVNVKIYNNVFAIQRMMNPPWKPGVMSTNNQMINLAKSGYPNPGNDLQWHRIHQTNYSQLYNSQPWPISKPGPRWYNYQSHPATQDISTKIAPQFFSSSP